MRHGQFCGILLGLKVERCYAHVRPTSIEKCYTAGRYVLTLILALSHPNLNPTLTLILRLAVCTTGRVYRHFVKGIIFYIRSKL